MDDVAAAEMARALGHPLRLGYLRALRERKVLSPSEFAKEAGKPLGNVSYHVKALAEAQVIVIKEKVPRRGAMENRYTLTGRHAKLALRLIDLLAAA
jgi:DNA-binding transcriptional ArsR family regulator